jgi:hypothetical protein
MKGCGIFQGGEEDIGGIFRRCGGLEMRYICLCFQGWLRYMCIYTHDAGAVVYRFGEPCVLCRRYLSGPKRIVSGIIKRVVCLMVTSISGLLS